MVIDTSILNPLEHEIYEKLMTGCTENRSLRIMDAAALCGCSTSKISKFVKKLGFDNFKQFMAFAAGEMPEEKPHSTERERLQGFLNEFDEASIRTFLEQMRPHSKIILLGLGPSAYCAQYMEYKLRLLLPDKLIISVPDIVALETLVDQNTLLVIFSTTGRFRSFGETCEIVRSRGGRSMLVIEEYNPELVRKYEQDQLIFLTTSSQSSQLKAHEKSRAITFIFIEEVLFRLMRDLGWIPE